MRPRKALWYPNYVSERETLTVTIIEFFTTKDGYSKARVITSDGRYHDAYVTQLKDIGPAE
jgi:hypothetical protein